MKPPLHNLHSTPTPQAFERGRRTLIYSWAALGTIFLVLLALRGLGLIMPALQLLMWGMLIGFMCSPITNFLEDKGLPRTLAALIALAVVIGVVILALNVLLPPFIRELTGLLREVPHYISQAQDFVMSFISAHAADSDPLNAPITKSISALSDFAITRATELATKLSEGFITNLMSTVSHMVTFFLGLVCAFWFAKDYPVLMREAAVIVGPKHQQDMTLMVAVVSRSMGGYMRGIVITSCVGGLLSFLGFVIIGHPYAGLMGITVGILHLIPVIGPWIAAAIAMALALIVSPMLALASLVVSLVAQNVTDNVISPLVMQSAVQVHPLLSLTALMVGDALGGVLGMALAIPASAALKGVFVYYFESRTKRRLVSYDGALFKGTPYSDAQGNILPSFDALDDDKYLERTRLVSRVGDVEVHAQEPPETSHLNIAERIAGVRRYNKQVGESEPEVDAAPTGTSATSEQDSSTQDT